MSNCVHQDRVSVLYKTDQGSGFHVHHYSIPFCRAAVTSTEVAVRLTLSIASFSAITMYMSGTMILFYFTDHTKHVF